MRELDPFVRVEGIDWEDGKLVISGCAYVPSMDIRKRRHTSKIVLLRPRQLGRLPVVVPRQVFPASGGEAVVGAAALRL